jgi:hypothetical protein
MKALYGVFKKKEVSTIGGVMFFPDNVDESKLTLMIGDDLRKMDSLAKTHIKYNEEEVILRKLIF